MKVPLKSNLIWHLLLLDVFFLALRMGGLTVLDLFVHASFLALATAALLVHHHIHTVPRSFYAIIIPVLLIVCVQLIPLPQSMFEVLAPLKWRVGQTAQQLFPEVSFSTQITMMPRLHLLKLASLALDIYALALLLMAPRPSSNTIRIWLFLYAVVFGALANMASNGQIDDASTLSFYQGTLGALINPNHFATFAIIVMVPILAQACVVTRRAILIYRNVKPTPIDDCVRKLLGALALLGALLILFSGFNLAYSRSGAINLTIAISTLCLFLGLAYRAYLRRRFLLLPVLAVCACIMIIPFTGALKKFEERGISSEQRLENLRLGLTFLQERPYLGTGLGSTEGILNQIFPQPPYRTTIMMEFHNDFLQTLVELGPLGLLALIGLVIWIVREAMSGLSESRFEARIMAATTLGIVFMLCFDSMISFPLRVTSIRLLVLVLVVFGLKLAEAPAKTPSRQAWRWSPLLLCAFAILATMLPTALDAVNAETYLEERELRYGRFTQAAMLAANRELTDIFNYNPPIEFTKERIPLIRAYTLEHLEGQVYSVQGLTILFMLAVMEERIAHQGQFDPEAYARFHAMAKQIGDLGNNCNAHAVAPWMFLFATYQAHLPEEDRIAFDKIRADWHYRYYEKQVEVFPETKGDYRLPAETEKKP